MKNETFLLLSFFLALFAFSGWYMAESDNQILIKENEALKARVHLHD